MFVLDHHNSIASHYINELRDIHVQKDRLRFRTNLERLGELLAYELSKTLSYHEVHLKTPLANITSKEIKDQLVVTTILRAGIPLYNGIVRYLDRADSAFIASYRVEKEAGEEIEINMEYVASGDLNGKTVILADPMLATGKSLIKAFEGLKKNGSPKHVHIVAAIASKQGVEYIRNNMDTPFSIWLGALDDGLNDKSYIVPGLGDAGDLSFGPKL